MCSRLLSFTLLISLSCFLRPPGFTLARPTVPHQHGALLPAVPPGGDTRHLLVPLPSLQPTSLLQLTLFHIALPHWPRSLPFSDPLSPSCPLAIPPLPPHALLPVPCPHCLLPSPLVQREQTELLIISVWQPLFCALIKGAACGLCVSGPYRRRRWANANITCLIIYVWETGTKASRGRR